MAMEYCPFCMEKLPAGAEFCPACGNRTDQENESHQLPVGTTLYSQSGYAFQVGHIKGEGGFGITYIGREQSSGRVVAIKEYFPIRCQPQREADGSVTVLPKMEESYSHGMRSFLSEASMLRAVGQIPSVVRVLDFFEANGTAYMVMEYLNGSTLQEIVERQGPLSFDALQKDLMPLLKDLGSLHEAGVLHRDIAPDNIMRLPDGSFKLLDFGCARAMEDGRSMTVVLKPGFAPLEQYTTRGQTPSTDIYALCATVFYCLTGRVPPAAPDRLMASVDGQPDPLPSPSSLGADIGQEQELILQWGLGLQPNSRPQKVEDLLARMEAPRPAPAPAPAPAAELPSAFYQSETGAEKLKRYLTDNKLLVGIVLGAVVLLLIFLLGS